MRRSLVVQWIIMCKYASVCTLRGSFFGLWVYRRLASSLITNKIDPYSYSMTRLICISFLVIFLNIFEDYYAVKYSYNKNPHNEDTRSTWYWERKQVHYCQVQNLVYICHSSIKQLVGWVSIQSILSGPFPPSLPPSPTYPNFQEGFLFYFLFPVMFGVVTSDPFLDWLKYSENVCLMNVGRTN